MINDKPSLLPNMSPFRLDPFEFVLSVREGYEIPSGVTAELYNGVNLLLNAESIDVTVSAQFITVSFTQEQVEAMPSLCQVYVIWGNKRRLMANLSPGMGHGTLELGKIKVDIFEILIAGDTGNAILAAERAELARDIVIEKEVIVSENTTIVVDLAEQVTTNATIVADNTQTTLDATTVTVAAKDQAVVTKAAIDVSAAQVATDSAAAIASKNNAAISESNSAVAYVGAEQAKNIAIQKASEAAASRDAAALASGIEYGTIAEGLASSAVPNGGYFKVRGSGLVAFSTYLKVNSTAAELYIEYPSSEALADVPGLKDKANILSNLIKSDGKGNLNFTDLLGFIAMFLDSSGVLNTKNIVSSLFSSAAGTISDFSASTIDLSDIFVKQNKNYFLVITDSDGWIKAGINKDFTTFGFDSVVTEEAARIFGKMAFVNHYVIYGQSLSVDFGQTDLESGTTPFVFTFHGGPVMWRTDADPTKYDSLDLISTGIGTFAMGRMLKQSILDTGYVIDGTTKPYDILVSAPGFASTSIQELSKGTAHYTRFLAGVENGVRLANAAGKTYNLPAVFWMQGESNYATEPQLYRSLIKTLRSDIDADVKALTGQKNDVIFLMYQPNSEMQSGQTAALPLEMLNIGLTEKNFYAGPPTYSFPHADNIHLTKIGYTKIAATAGYILEKIIVEGIEWKPIYAESWTITGNQVDIRMHVPKGLLVFDTVTVADPGNFGFQLYNASGVLQTLTSVTIPRQGVVRIISSGAISAGFTLTYAVNNGTSGTSGPTTGPRGCLRDTQGDTVIYTSSGLNYALHNWCPKFSITL